MRGGKRPGTGRKAGGKNKLTIGKELQERGELPATGLMPIDVMLEVLRDMKQPIELRLDAAKSAAPYFHKKQPQEHKVDATVYMPPPVVLIYDVPDDPPGTPPLTH